MPQVEPALKKFGANVRARRDLAQDKLFELTDVYRTYVYTYPAKASQSLNTVVRW
jgi:hypothetical protein